MSATYKNMIINMIDEQNYSDIEKGLYERSCWKTTGDITATLGHITTGCAAIIAFAAGSFNIWWLPFVAGCLSTLSILLLKFSDYSMHESKDSTDETNRLLTKMGLDTIVDISNVPVTTNTDPLTNNSSAAKNIPIGSNDLSAPKADPFRNEHIIQI